MITDPELIGLNSIEIHGKGFGTKGSLTCATHDGSLAQKTLSSTTKGAIWTDTHILMPVLSGNCDVTVRTDAGVSNTVHAEWWPPPLETPIAPTANTDARPLAITLAADGRTFFVNQEFHRDLQTIGGALSPPRPPDPGPFAAFFDPFCLGGNCVNDADTRTQTSVLGEDIIADSLGRIWYSEGGGLLYEQRVSTHDPSKQVMTFPNHSRIVMFDPSSSSFRVYNIPGDRNEVVGLAQDVSSSKIWFCEGGRVGGNKIGELDPDVAKFDTASPSFDFATDADATGYTFFEVPKAKSFPAMPLVDPDGHVWFTMYLGNALGRLDPSTTSVEIFPLPAPRAKKGPATIFATGGPWRIVFSPQKDFVVVGEQYDFEITRLDAKRVRSGDAACRSLDALGQNPCMRSISVDDPASFPDGSPALLHSIIWSDRLWFTEMGSTDPAAADDRIGFVTDDFAHVVAFPRGSFGGPNGIAGTAGNLFFAEFNGRAVGQIAEGVRH